MLTAIDIATWNKLVKLESQCCQPAGAANFTIKRAGQHMHCKSSLGCAHMHRHHQQAPHRGGGVRGSTAINTNHSYTCCHTPSSPNSAVNFS